MIFRQKWPNFGPKQPKISKSTKNAGAPSKFDGAYRKIDTLIHLLWYSEVKTIPKMDDFFGRKKGGSLNYFETRL